MIRDAESGLTENVGATRYVEDGVTKNISVAYVVENGVTALVFKESKNEYEFTKYEHNEPGGAVEVISDDGSTVTITVPEKNFGGTAFYFISDIPESAVGNDLTISLKVNASYSGTLGADHSVSVGVTCANWGVYTMGEYYVSGWKEFSYTVPGSNVVDRVKLSLNATFFGDFDKRGTYTFAVKDVVINGKPCKFNF